MTTKTVLAGGVAALCLALLAPATALAQPSTPTPAPSGGATVTLSPEQLQYLCTKRLPKAETRTTKLIERINGGPEVRGSAKALQARAEKERAAGRETSAQLLDEKAQRRTGKVEQLTKIKQWVTEFRTQQCGGVK